MPETAQATPDATLPGMDPGTTPGAAGGTDSSPGSETKLFFGKYKTMEEATQGWNELVKTNVDLKEQFGDMQDSLVDLQNRIPEEPATPDPQTPPATPTGKTFEESWNTHDYGSAIDQRVSKSVESLVKSSLDKALVGVSKSQEEISRRIIQQQSDAVVAKFEADTENHPGFSDLKSEIFRAVKERRRANADYGKGMETHDLLHLLYLEAAEKDPDTVKKARNTLASITSGGGASPPDAGTIETESTLQKPKQLDRKVWQALSLKWNPEQYKLSPEDQRNMAATVELEYYEKALAQQRKELMGRTRRPAAA